jgi:hypothetical protein
MDTNRFHGTSKAAEEGWQVGRAMRVSAALREVYDAVKTIYGNRHSAVGGQQTQQFAIGN